MSLTPDHVNIHPAHLAPEHAHLRTLFQSNDFGCEDRNVWLHEDGHLEETCYCPSTGQRHEPEAYPFTGQAVMKACGMVGGEPQEVTYTGTFADGRLVGMTHAAVAMQVE